jgi:hypothetical protein
LKSVRLMCLSAASAHCVSTGDGGILVPNHDLNSPRVSRNPEGQSYTQSYFKLTHYRVSIPSAAVRKFVAADIFRWHGLGVVRRTGPSPLTPSPPKPGREKVGARGVELNPRPAAYKAAALPLSYSGVRAGSDGGGLRIRTPSGWRSPGFRDQLPSITAEPSVLAEGAGIEPAQP